MKSLVIFFAIVQVSRIKSDNESNILQSRLFSSEESRETQESNFYGSSEQEPDVFLRPPNCGTSNATRNRIVAGKFASEHKFPWIVALGYMFPFKKQLRWHCGGTLITKKHVITAAHCIYKNQKHLKMARVGSLYTEKDIYKDYKPGQDIPIGKKIIHKNYEPTKALNDIAIVTLSQTIVAPMVWPICLPVDYPFSRQSYVNKKVTVAGWGANIYEGPLSPLLKYVSLDVVPSRWCRKQFKLPSSKNIVCAGDPLWTKDACQGDSGGPLMYKAKSKKGKRYYLIGVVSFGYKCAERGSFGVYTAIIPYLEWIRKQISKN